VGTWRVALDRTSLMIGVTVEPMSYAARVSAAGGSTLGLSTFVVTERRRVHAGRGLLEVASTPGRVRVFTVHLRAGAPS
jgi:hypothetical protein